jgi:hypothetical protein
MTSTNMTYAPDSQSDLEWFTHDILPNGRQICSIRQIEPPSPNRLVLDEEVSTLLQTLLTEIGSDRSIPFSSAKQAVLRAFMRATRSRKLAYAERETRYDAYRSARSRSSKAM